MRTKLLIASLFTLVVLLVLGFTSLQTKKYYYAYNEKIYLNELDNKRIVRYKHSKKSDKGQVSLAAELAEKQFEWKDDSTCVITITPYEKELFRTKN